MKDDDVHDSGEHTPVDPHDDGEGPTNVASDPPPYTDSKVSSLPKLQPGVGPSTEEETLAPGTMVGEYRIERQVGEGGMGTVYSATHPVIGKRAAVKVIKQALGWDRGSVARFMQEARSVNQINHPNIVDVFSFGNLPDGRCYFVMEWLAGRSLAQYLREGPLEWAECTRILDQISDALEAAHEKGIVHRDLKPENVCLVPARGQRHQVKLLDFGIAKLKGADSGVGTTQTGVVMGTPAYLSPEQARGKSVDQRTDIYALGCMGYELMTGHLPFEAESAVDIIAMHLNQVPPRLDEKIPDVPTALADLLWRMMSKKAVDRPSLVEVRATCQDLLADPMKTPARPLKRSDVQNLRLATTGTLDADQVTDSAQTLDTVSPVNTTTAPVERRRSGMSSWPAILLIAALVGLAAYLVFLRDTDDPPSTPTPTVAPLAEPAPAPAPVPVATTPDASPPDAAPPAPPEDAPPGVALTVAGDLAAGAFTSAAPSRERDRDRHKKDRPRGDTAGTKPDPAPPEPAPPEEKPPEPARDPKDYTINPFAPSPNPKNEPKR